MNIKFNSEINEFAKQFPIYQEDAFRDVKIQKLVSSQLLSNTSFYSFYNSVFAFLSENNYVVINDFPDKDNLLLGFASCFGYVSEPYQSGTSRLIQNMTYNPKTESIVSVFHTDDSGWKESSRYVFLLIVQSDDHEGGRTRILKSQDLISSIKQINNEDVFKMLCSLDFPFKDSSSSCNDLFYKNIISVDESGIISVRYLAETINDGILLNPVSAIHIEVLSLFHDFLQIVSPSFDELLQSGTLVIFDNHHSMHMKTKLLESSNRLVKRVKVFEKSHT